MPLRLSTSMSEKNRHADRNEIDLIRALPTHLFDYSYLMWVLKLYRSPRDKIGRMLKKKQIIQLKRGLYTLSPEYGGDVDRRAMANLIYGPSYISLEYALSFWGLIPERVEEVTSMTNKRNKLFDTPFGSFSYKYINSLKFSQGVTLEDTGNAYYGTGNKHKISFFIATKEKAICDQIASVNEIKKEKDLTEYLANHLRIDPEALFDLDVALLKRIENAYKKIPVKIFTNWAAGISR